MTADQYPTPLTDAAKFGTDRVTVSFARDLERRLALCREALEFYGDPGSYFGVGIFADPPCGGFAYDLSETVELGVKPGKLAREALAATEPTP